MFRDRVDAGFRLGEAVRTVVKDEEMPVVYGIPRGGVVVAAEVARALHAPLDVAVIRKLGAPGNPELGIGAVAESGDAVLDESIVERLAVPQGYIDVETAHQTAEVLRRIQAYRGDVPGHAPAGRTCVVVDDGIATGGTVRAAVASLRRRGAARVVLAVPVASREGLAAAGAGADETVCLAVPDLFSAVGQWYEEFPQVPDEEVVAILEASA